MGAPIGVTLVLHLGSQPQVMDPSHAATAALLEDSLCVLASPDIKLNLRGTQGRCD
jgi:hypothetical protein